MSRENFNGGSKSIIKRPGSSVTSPTYTSTYPISIFSYLIFTLILSFVSSLILFLIFSLTSISLFFLIIFIIFYFTLTSIFIFILSYSIISTLYIISITTLTGVFNIIINPRGIIITKFSFIFIFTIIIIISMNRSLTTVATP